MVKIHYVFLIAIFVPLSPYITSQIAYRSLSLHGLSRPLTYYVYFYVWSLDSSRMRIAKF